MLIKRKKIPVKIPIMDTAMVAPIRSEASCAVGGAAPVPYPQKSFLYVNES
jgi:hypothetical protein